MGLIALLLEICSLLVILSASPDLLFANRRDLRIVSVMFNETSKTSEAIVTHVTGDAYAVDYVWSEGTIYWTDVSMEVIRKINVSSGVEEVVVSTRLAFPDGLACDWVGLKLYWTDADTDCIEVSELNGTSRKVLVWDNIDQPRAVTVDPRRGYIFWSDWGEEPKIERAGMDGTERTILIDEQISWPNGLTIDYNSSRLFWADAMLHYIHSCLFDGTDRTLILDDITQHPFAISVFRDTIYWTDWETMSIHACEKSTGRMLNPVLRDLYYPMDIHVYTSERQPPRDQNPCQGNSNCSHLCLLSPSSPFFSCACPTGVGLLEDGRTCADGPQNILLLARREDIKHISLDTPDYTTFTIGVPAKDVRHAIAISYDPVEDYVYWTDDELKSIQRVKLDGTEAEYLVKENLGAPDGIAIDWIARNMYWTDSEFLTIEVARLNGSSRKVVIQEDVDKPRAIAVHPILGLMFWTDWGVTPKIERAALDGSNRSVLANDSLVWPNGITIDYQAGLVYWGDGKLDTIEFMGLNGENRSILKRNFTPHVFGFSLLDNFIYWTDWQSRTIERLHKETGEDHEVLIEELADLMGLMATNVHAISGTNPCADNNGGCSHLCFFRPSGHICACPTGMELLGDAQTCILPEAFLLLCFKNDIQRISLETTFNNVEIPLAGVEEANSLDFDFTDSMIYWSDQEVKKISKAYLNGTGHEDVIEFGIQTPTSLAVDWIAHNIYFSDMSTKRIEVARLDGYSRRVLIWQNISQPVGLVLDPPEGYMYFVDWDQSRLERAYLDGSNRKVIMSDKGNMKGLTIDYIEKRLYWANLDQSLIESTDMLGQQLRVTMEMQASPMGMTQFRDFVYWIDSAKKTVERANKSDGSNRTVIQTLNDGDIVTDLMVFHASKQTGWNACGHNNSGCQHLCFSLPNKTNELDYRCECPTHYELNSDGKTCHAPETFLLYSLKNAVGRLHMDYMNHPDVILPIRNLRNVKVIEYDYQNNSLIWIDAKQKDIVISHNDGLHRRVLVSHWSVGPSDSDEINNPCDIALDPYGRRLFWTDAQTNVINVTRLDGTPIGVVVEGRHPRLITLIAEKGLMFWFNISPQPSIERALLNGDESVVIVALGLGEIKALTADHATERIYWVDTILKLIESADALGSTREILVELPNGLPVGLTVSGSYVYWADRRLHQIQRISKQSNHRNEPQLVKTPLIYLTDILAVGPRYAGGHPCSKNNGGCSHLCVALDDGEAKCSCPLHLSLLGTNNCGDPPTCSPFEFLCPATSENCLPLAWKCDGSPDCDDQSDEEDCPYCPLNEFRCESGECLSEEKRCDRVQDCSEGDKDEKDCAPCAPEQLECGSGECVSMEQICNGYADCLDGSDEVACVGVSEDISDPNPESSSVSHAAVGSLVSIGVVSLLLIGVVLLVRRCPWNQGNASGSYTCDPASNSYTFQLNHLGGEHSTQKYLSRHERRVGHIKSTNLHMCTSSSKSNAKCSSSSALYERNRPTGASSMSSEHVSSSNSSYPKETLNPPPSPVTERSHCTTEIYYTPAHKMNTSINTSRSYRHYKMRNIPPPPTPCSTDVCEDSEPIPQTHHKHTRRKKGYAKVPNIDPVNVDSEPYPPPPTPQYLSDSCPPSPSTGRSCFNPYPPPPSVATDSS